MTSLHEIMNIVSLSYLSSLSHLTNIVMSLLKSQSSETQGRLTPSTVLLRQIHTELMQHLFLFLFFIYMLQDMCVDWFWLVTKIHFAK